MTFWLSNRLLKQLASKVASPGEYVADCLDWSTSLEGCVSSRQVVIC